MLGHLQRHMRHRRASEVYRASSQNYQLYPFARYLVGQKCIKPLCDMLFFEDPKICVVALEALENILRVCAFLPTPRVHVRVVSFGAPSYTRMPCVLRGLACGAVRKQVGRRDALQNGGPNKYAAEIDEAGGVTKIEQLQRHVNPEIYAKANSIIETYFSEPEGEEDGAVAPATNESGQFTFNVSLPAGVPALSSAPTSAAPPAPAAFFAAPPPAPASTTAPSPFGTPATVPAPASVTAPSPFGTPAAPAPSPFGAPAAPSPFGAAPVFASTPGPFGAQPASGATTGMTETPMAPAGGFNFAS